MKSIHNQVHRLSLKDGLVIAHVKIQFEINSQQDVGACQFEEYARFCIECDRKGMKPLKHADFLNIG